METDTPASASAIADPAPATNGTANGVHDKESAIINGVKNIDISAEKPQTAADSTVTATPTAAAAAS
jgi:hypothetical protein